MSEAKHTPGPGKISADIRPKPRRWRFWRRPKPTLHHRLLAMHIAGASNRSALR